MNFKYIFELIANGGYVIYILAACSIFSVKVIIEKLIEFRGITEKSIDQLMNNVYESLETDDIPDAVYKCKTFSTGGSIFKIRSPLSEVIRYILEHHLTQAKELITSAYIQLDKEMAKMEKGLGVLSTLGSISPFIGLFGTVIGIIQSFNALSVTTVSDYGAVMSGIADALIATAAGLIVAVPAVVFYNYFNKKMKLSLPLYDEAIQKTINYIKTQSGANDEKIQNRG